MQDLLIKKALIYDGSGAPAFYGSVGVTNGKITYVGQDEPSSKKTIDAQGLSLSPGFIDVHSHSDQVIFEDPLRLHVLRMGVTTELAGQCGGSRSPFSSTMDPAVKDFMRKSPFTFLTMKEEVEALGCLKMGVNQRYFTGHGVLRANAMGLANRTATDIEISSMKKQLIQAIREGAAGVSTGLSYVPGIYSNSEELVQLGKTAGENGGIYTTHSRSESMGLFDCINECIRIAREGQVPVNISHFKIVGKVFWDRCDKALNMIDEAIADGLDLTLDAYPYTAVSTTTLSAIPPQFLDKGAVYFAESLNSSDVVQAIFHEIYEVNSPTWDNSIYYVGLDNFLIVRAKETPWAIGKTYAQAAKEMGMTPFEGMIYLLKANHGDIYECRFAMCEENVSKILKHPRCMVGSDGLYAPGDVSAHPRAFGTFPRYLGRYIRNQSIMSREDGIHHITGMPAHRYGLKGKGQIKIGYDADMVLFDFDRIIDHADFHDPFLPNEGVHQVYVAGELALEENEATDVRNGKYLC